MVGDDFVDSLNYLDSGLQVEITAIVVEQKIGKARNQNKKF
jgi:hypothetical protein